MFNFNLQKQKLYIIYSYLIIVMSSLIYYMYQATPTK